MRKKEFIMMRKALTLIEVIMVIVILGIVASIGSSMIADSYKNYLLQNTTHKAVLKTEIAAQQISNLLANRIPGTTLARNPNNLNDNLHVSDPTVPNDNNHSLLEWIAYDEESFTARIGAAGKPGWSGFCDVNSSSATIINTPGSNLAFAHTIMNNLSGGRVGLNNGSLRHPAIFFRNNFYQNDPITGNRIPYDALTCMGMIDNNTSCISTVERVAGSTTQLKFRPPASTRLHKVIAEHYKLARSAYSICPKLRTDGHYDLILYYNYQPWEGDRLTPAAGAAGTNHCNFSTGQKAVLIRNVTVFKFAEAGNVFRFKLCAQESYGGDYNVTICKEKAVIR